VRLRQLTQQFPGQIELVHRAFLLRPEETAGATFTEYYLRHRRAAREMTGLPFELPEVGAPYPRSSFPALVAAKWVEQHHPERFEEYDLALFHAFFEKTRDISSTEVLAAVAEALGLPADGLVEALRSRQYAGAVFADHEEAMQLGIHSIPTVVAGGRAVSGAVAYEEYERLARRLLGGPEDGLITIGR